MLMIKQSLSRVSRSLLVVGVCAAAVMSLQGCVELLVGSAVVGTFATADRRTFGAQTKDKAENELKAVEGVVSVINEIQIAGTSNLTARSNDALITTKVKASFVDTKDLYANSYKVVTEASVVYLMGRVTQREGERAADVASSVSGVRKVVKVFEYMTEEELKALLVQPAKSEKSAEAK